MGLLTKVGRSKDGMLPTHQDHVQKAEIYRSSILVGCSPWSEEGSPGEFEKLKKGIIAGSLQSSIHTRGKTKTTWNLVCHS
jgi:hypothetical protein